MRIRTKRWRVQANFRVSTSRLTTTRKDYHGKPGLRCESYGRPHANTVRETAWAAERRDAHSARKLGCAPRAALAHRAVRGRDLGGLLTPFRYGPRKRCNQLQG